MTDDPEEGHGSLCFAFRRTSFATDRHQMNRILTESVLAFEPRSEDKLMGVGGGRKKSGRVRCKGDDADLKAGPELIVVYMRERLFFHATK